MDRIDLALALGMLCLMLGTMLTGFSRPLWWALHRRRPDGRRELMQGWMMRIPGILLLVIAAGIMVMSIREVFLFQV